MTRRLIIVGALLILAIVAFFGLRSCFRAENAAENASAPVTSARESGVADAAINAVAVTANTMTMASEIDDLTRSNADAIRSAPGADTRVPAASNDVALQRLCLRATYRDQPRCVALLGSRPRATGR